MAAATTKVAFAGSDGAQLAGTLELPDVPPRAWALFAHCFTCGKDSVATSRISRALAKLGVAVLRFDFTGLGNSEGDFTTTGFSSNVDDLICAAEYLRANHQAPTLLVGHSLGGAAVLAAAHRIPGTRAVVTLAAPADTAHVVKLMSVAVEEIEASGAAEVFLGGRPFRIRREFLDDVATQPQQDRIRNLGAALLVLHSPTDELVEVDNARQIFEAARHPKSFVAIDGADHLLTRKVDADYVANVIAAWASRYLPADQPDPAPDAEPISEGVVRVTESPLGQLVQRIIAGGHELVADEPRPMGDDTGPTPYDLLLSGLGACTSMTVRMYADRKGWPLERVSVELSHSRVHARDCAQCDTESGTVDRIEREMRFEGDLSDEQRARLLDIADKCPVHRTLTSENNIRTVVAPDP
ncbi:alpha/beta fold hydrolase [uncultured Mycolicibacterium sp.]|uniref:bifunctional alpha/beta hydrolase/OsmC family protein n=1 Tax=uncultured Mycolicibacterium sp. TaxID=2320817 RepID=UPI0032B1B915